MNSNHLFVRPSENDVGETVAEPVIIESKDSVLWIRINREERRNALNEKP